jgi:hypothetical protein
MIGVDALVPPTTIQPVAGAIRVYRLAMYRGA